MSGLISFVLTFAANVLEFSDAARDNNLNVVQLLVRPCTRPILECSSDHSHSSPMAHGPTSETAISALQSSTQLPIPKFYGSVRVSLGATVGVRAKYGFLSDP